MKKHYRHENDCLNCKTLLEGKFCHNCGQENLQMKESFGHMITHAVSDYFHFDDQFFHTIKPLFFKPGKLTNEYLAGRRAQYLHPVKMYIFISLISFLIFLHGSEKEVLPAKDIKTNGQQVADSIKAVISKNKNLTPEQKKAAIEQIRISTNKDITNNDVDVNNKGEPVILGVKIKNGDTYQQYLAKQAKLAPAKRDNFLERFIAKKGYDWKSQGKDAQKMFIEAFKHNIPKMAFILLPLFAFILSIAFWNNKKFYVEHIIYAIHLHCFMYLLLALEILLKMILPDNWKILTDSLDLLTFLAICYYVYRSLRVVYNRSRWRTVSKLIGVSIMYLIVSGFCFILILAVTAVTTV